MASPLTLSRVWRIVKEVDLDAIRREAGRRAHILVVGETTADADALAIRLARGQVDPAPYLTAVDAPLAALGLRHIHPGGHQAPGDTPTLVVAVTRGGETSADMTAARKQWAARQVPLVTVAIGTAEEDGTVHSNGCLARVSIDRLDDGGFRHVIDGLFQVVTPDSRASLARRFPTLRPKIFNAIVEDTARANAGYAFSTGLAEIVPILDIPLNIGDIVVLTKNQLMMSYRLALAAGKTGQPRELIGEILGVLGGGLLFRQAARQLVGLLPVIGLVPKVAVAYGGTWAIGRAVVLWATGGGAVTRARLRELSREGLARGREVARSFRRAGDI
jgi:uncharacterized protein (DUF697 family)